MSHLLKHRDVFAQVTYGSVPRWHAPGGCRTASPAWWTRRSCLQRECTVFRVSHIHFSVCHRESVRYLPSLCVPPCGCRSWGGRGCCGWWRPELLEYPNHCEGAQSVVNTRWSWATLNSQVLLWNQFANCLVRIIPRRLRLHFLPSCNVRRNQNFVDAGLELGEVRKTLFLDEIKRHFQSPQACESH